MNRVPARGLYGTQEVGAQNALWDYSQAIELPPEFSIVGRMREGGYGIPTPIPSCIHAAMGAVIRRQCPHDHQFRPDIPLAKAREIVVTFISKLPSGTCRSPAL
jgi:hypothetical protein